MYVYVTEVFYVHKVCKLPFLQQMKVCFKALKLCYDASMNKTDSTPSITPPPPHPTPPLHFDERNMKRKGH